MENNQKKTVKDSKKKTVVPTQDEIRTWLIERCKDCMCYAPMIIPELLGYLECEISGDWSGWFKEVPENDTKESKSKKTSKTKTSKTPKKAKSSKAKTSR